MTPALFLTIAGPASLFIGILGIFAPGLAPEFWFDITENVVHTGFGIIALIVLTKSARIQEQFVLWVSLLTLGVAAGGLLVIGKPAPNFLITNLEHPIDNALHTTFALVGLTAAWTNRALLHKKSFIGRIGRFVKGMR